MHFMNHTLKKRLFGRRPQLLHLSGDIPCQAGGAWIGRNLPPRIVSMIIKKREQSVLVFLIARGGFEPLLCAKYIVNTRASHHLFLKSKQK